MKKTINGIIECRDNSPTSVPRLLGCFIKYLQEVRFVVLCIKPELVGNLSEEILAVEKLFDAALG